ncbi:hypothetical protein E2C01_048984 [Portunus trituberculatus]|uniref:Uncharacterized protein n=1 Tax=Portunus trituberculatus TaxID=210409 RepID=A0A5B7G805_PORTR|nr:hypothetical protein [Portunus trituberculatus]
MTGRVRGSGRQGIGWKGHKRRRWCSWVKSLVARRRAGCRLVGLAGREVSFVWAGECCNGSVGLPALSYPRGTASPHSAHQASLVAASPLRFASPHALRQSDPATCLSVNSTLLHLAPRISHTCQSVNLTYVPTPDTLRQLHLFVSQSKLATPCPFHNQSVSHLARHTDTHLLAINHAAAFTPVTHAPSTLVYQSPQRGHSSLSITPHSLTQQRSHLFT